ncbi:MurR/RpiR family transcriptional regulator [Dermatobacter hominis]|uniref:MurR/RpiR family transcriptional regulator n=1 Tax=Dermatobacter hominis TaxID=2884263 RepID=UPI001D12BBCA|nr:MurR/RpiR family transcriptional regulator [Dermatobacter hominis]UDY35256.1 MurR/RpiR family transcriptional regulator [Dermatobacter hominis]
MSERLASAGASISPAERKVAEVVAADRELVAFGTVAEVAARAGASGASVVRLADRLGYAGFRGLQDAVRAEISGRLRPATEKIRRPAPGDLVGALAEAAEASIRGTFASLARDDVDRAVSLLSQRRRRVLVLSGDAGSGVGRQAVTHLSMVRDGVEELGGSAVAVGRLLSRTAEGDVLLCIDLPRHDRWVLDAVGAARARGVLVLAVTDSPLSPLATDAEVVVAVESHDVGPFDSYVAVLAVVEVLVAGVAHRLRSSAAEHLDVLEAVWEETGAIDPE